MSCKVKYKNQIFPKGAITKEMGVMAEYLEKLKEKFKSNYEHLSMQKERSMRSLLEDLKRRSGFSYEFISFKEAQSLVNLQDFNSAFIKDGKIYFVKELFNEEDAVHEYAHIYLKVIQRTNPELYAELIDDLYDNKLAREYMIESMNVNKHYTEEEHEQEAITKLIGLQGKNIINESTIERIMNKIIEYISKWLGFPVSFDDKIKNLSIQLLSSNTSLQVNGINVPIPSLLFNTRKDPNINALKNEATQIRVVNKDHYEILGNPTKFERLTNYVIQTSSSTNKKRFYGDPELEANDTANKLWDGKPDTEVLKIDGLTFDNTTLLLDKAAYIKAFINYRTAGSIKGNLFHSTVDKVIKGHIGESTTEVDKDILKYQEQAGGSYAWINEKDIAAFMENLGIYHNAFNRAKAIIPPALEDILSSELSIVSDILGIGTTIDLMVSHFDGRYSMFDWKTSSRLDFSYSGALMDSIKDTPKNRAKMEVMLRAVMVRLQNKDIKFKRLSVLQVKNDWQLKHIDPEGDVDVPLFLKTLENYLRRSEPAKYAAMLAKTPDVFNVEAYIGISQKTALQKVALQINSDHEFVEYLRKEIVDTKWALDYQTQKGYSTKTQINGVWVEAPIVTKLKELTKMLAEYERLPGMGTMGSKGEDIGKFKAYFGQYGDINSYELQSMKAQYESAKQKIEAEVHELNVRLEKASKDLIEEYKSEHAIVAAFSFLTKGYLNFINVTELFSPLFKKNAQNIEVLITPEDKEWSNLSEPKRKFLLFLQGNYTHLVGDMLTREFTVYENQKQTLMDIMFNPDQYNYTGIIHTEGKTKSLSKGFFAKIPITENEYREREGIFSKNTLHRTWANVKNTFLKDPHTKSGDIGLPLKYMNHHSDYYSYNLASGFQAFARVALEKKYLDPVYASMIGYQKILESTTKNVEGKEVVTQPNLLEFVKAKIVMDYEKTTFDEKWSENLGNVDVKKIESLWRQWVSLVLMAVKPVHGLISGGITPFVIGFKKGIANTISAKILGVKGIEFQEKDWFAASALYLDMLKDRGMGNLETNKMWLLVKQMNYLTSDLPFEFNQNNAVIEKNPLLNMGTLYLTHTFWENANAAITLIAQLKAMKLADGTSIFDNYEVVTKNDGIVNYDTVEWKGPIRGYEMVNGKEVPVGAITSKELTALKRVYERMNGGYRHEEKVAAEAYSSGRILMQFKKYITSSLTGAFGSRHIDMTTGRYVEVGKAADGKPILEWQSTEIEGRYRLLAKLLRDVITLKGKKNWENLTDHDKKELIEAMFTILLFIMCYFAAGALYGDDDDDESKKAYLRIVENMSQHYNFIDWARTLRQSPAAFSKTWDTGLGVIQLFLLSPINYSTGGDYLTADGKIKGTVQTIKGIPGLAGAYTTLKFFENNEMTGDQTWLEYFTEDLSFR